MFSRSLILAGTLLVAAPALADAPAQSSSNWEVFQKLYPKRAIAAREEGAVGFKVTLDSKGEVTGCQVTHSSGYPLLDQETCQLVTLHAQFSPDPGLGVSQTKTHEGVIAWKLPASTAALSAPKMIAEGKAPEKVVCKKVPRTGSLASFDRTCMTPREWAKQADESRQPYEELQGKKGSTSGN